MIPIHKLLSRIRWDKEFGCGNFAIGYYDRLLGQIIRVPFSEIIFTPDNHNSIQIMDHEGVIHSVPLHRIKEVYKDNESIWHREYRAI
jgi:uncharacterized protein (UPF0248 family)